MKNAETIRNSTLARNYARMISDVIEQVCVKRIEEIEGRVPDLNEILKHGEQHVSEGSKICLYLWRGKPICEFVPAHFSLKGWNNASVKEIRSEPATRP